MSVPSGRVATAHVKLSTGGVNQGDQEVQSSVLLNIVNLNFSVLNREYSCIPVIHRVLRLGVKDRVCICLLPSLGFLIYVK